MGYTPFRMKAKYLYHPTSWEERRPLFHEGVFFLAKHYSDYSLFSFPKWNDPLCFGNENPVRVEFCSGNGLWVIEKAKQHPEINWVAVEKRFDRVQKIWAKKEIFSLRNLLIVYGEAHLFTSEYLPDQGVSEVYINFPDPWPKGRHAKHRLIQAPFVSQLARILPEGGKVTIVTDDLLYREQVEMELGAEPRFSRSEVGESHFVGYGSSFFEELWRRQGKEIFYLQYKRLPCLDLQ